MSFASRVRVLIMLAGSLAGFGFVSLNSAFAATGTVIGSIAVEQKSPTVAIGTWTLLKPDQTSLKFTTATYTVDVTDTGNYTLFTEPPSGMSATMTLLKGDTVVQTLERPQISFILAEGDQLRIEISYKLTRTGEVVVNSNPGGIPFRMEGPNKTIVHEVTPFAVPIAPEGQYTVYYQPPGCIAPRPQSFQLRKDGRINFSITIDCATLEVEEPEEPVAPEDKTVTVRVDGEDVRLTDVPQNAWFAPFVFTVAKSGIVSGYRDASGAPTGLFGPENAITIAELTKIAHKLAGINEADVTAPPQNRKAKGQWFAQFIASAENLDWVLFLDVQIDPARPATRGEVIQTLLQALDVPLQWPKGTVFTDVNRHTPHAAAIETAAAKGIVTGSSTTGKAGGAFRPGENINRAEVAKIVGVMMEKYRIGE